MVPRVSVILEEPRNLLMNILLLCINLKGGNQRLLKKCCILVPGLVLADAGTRRVMGQESDGIAYLGL